MKAYLKWRQENPDEEGGPPGKDNPAGELEEDESEEADDYDDEEDD